MTPSDFGDFEGRVWLNCAHQGPLPKVAVDAAYEAIDWKRRPFYLSTSEPFDAVPARMKAALGRLIGVPAGEVILTNGASYGLHLLANGLSLRAGDEVLLMEGDFPSNILPWLALRERGVRVTQIPPERYVLDPDEVMLHLTPSVRVLCMSWVHSFSGYTADLETIGAACRANGTAFVVNATQGLGARPIDVTRVPVDALVSAGWKWLCGPYATGVCWIRPELRAGLAYNQAYWLAVLTADQLGRDPVPLERPAVTDARAFDVFGTANFFNFMPWAASVEYLLDIGIDRIRAHDQGLVDRLLGGLDRGRYLVLSPEAGPARSTLVFLSHRDRDRNRAAFEALRAAGIDVALRRGCLRVAPHVYNTEADVDRLLAALADFGAH